MPIHGNAVNKIYILYTHGNTININNKSLEIFDSNWHISILQEQGLNMSHT